MRVVVVGCEGFVGRNLTEALLLDNHEVLGVCSNRTSNQRRQASRSSYELTTISRFLKASSSHLTRADVLVNVAQHRNSIDFPSEGPSTLLTNSVLPLELLNVCRDTGISRMIHFSSGGLYDRSTSVILNESTPLARPEVLDFYLRSKLIADQVLELAESSMVDLTIVRPFFVFGSQMPSSRLFSRLISSLRHGSPVHLRNPDGIRINPCYVGDISEGVLRLLQRRSLRAVNFSGSDVLTLGEICRLFSDYLGCEYHFVSNSDPEDDCVSDTSMFSQLLGRSPRGLGDRELLNGLLA